MKFKVDIQNLLPEQENNKASEVKPARKRSDMPSLLSDFKASGESRGKLHLSLEFLDDSTYKKLSKAAREEDINKFTRIVQNSEKNVSKKKEELIGVIAGLDALTVPLGIKWYKDIAIGLLAGYAQESAEAALQAFKDADMSTVLIDLYQLFRVKQPQSKEEVVEIIKNEAPELLLPAKYQDPGRPSIFKLFGSYDEFFEDKVGTWTDPLADAFQRAYIAIDKILDIYSHPPLTKISRGNTTGRRVTLEGFVQFLDDVAIYKQHNSDEGLKRSRAEIFKAIQHSKGLSKAIIDAGKYLQLIKKYEEDPRMILGAYQSYNKADPYGIPGRVDIIAPFLNELIKRNLDYPGQEEATKQMIRINNEYFKPLARREASDEIDTLLPLEEPPPEELEFVKDLRINEEKRMKKIRVVFDDIKDLENKNLALVSEGRYSVDEILGLRLPSLDFGELGTTLVRVGSKRIPMSSKATGGANQNAVILAVDKIVSNTKDGEGLESLVKKAMKKSADDGGEPVIVTIKYEGKAKEGEVVGVRSTAQREIYVLVGPDGLVAVTRKISDADAIASSVLRRPASDVPMTPGTRDPSKPKGHIDNPFQTAEEMRKFLLGKGFGVLKNYFLSARSLSRKHPDIFWPVRVDETSTGFMYYGKPGAPQGSYGYINGKLVSSSEIEGVSNVAARTIDAEKFSKNPVGLLDDAEAAAYREVTPGGYEKFSRPGQVMRKFFPGPINRLLSQMRKIYFRPLQMPGGKEVVGRWFTVPISIVDLTTTGFGFRALEAAGLILNRELRVIGEKELIDAYSWIRLGRATMGVFYATLSAAGFAFRSMNSLEEIDQDIRGAESAYLSASKESKKQAGEILIRKKKEYVKAVIDWAYRNNYTGEDITNVQDYKSAKEFMKTADNKLTKWAQNFKGGYASLVSGDPFPAWFDENSWTNDNMIKVLRRAAEEQQLGIGGGDDSLSEKSVQKALDDLSNLKDDLVDGEDEEEETETVTPTTKTETEAEKKERLKREKEAAAAAAAEEARKKRVLNNIYRESKALGPVLENYLGVDIIKNIKIKPSSKARSGDKK